MCYLPMPFSRSARFVLTNDGATPYHRSVAYAVDWEADPATSASQADCTPAGVGPIRRVGLHEILKTEGKGHYVGNFLRTYTTYQGWWGEGDTIFGEDGKSITHSPGTEDEYGSTWGFGEKTFAFGACGHIENVEGRNLMYRWYAANPVRFRESLHVEIQNQR